MKVINWNAQKNQELIKQRGVSFDDVLYYLLQGEMLDDLQHHNQDKYPNQKMFVLAIDDYVYLVPYVETDEEIFLKTIIPSRKATKQYLGDDYE